MPLAEYDPQSIQERWSAFWEERQFFHSRPNPTKQPFSVVIPPPNVTGALHLGHALNGTLQDVIVRFKRMQGYETLWMPGADHAGIATQAVVEKRLFEEERKTRHDVGRKELVRRIWAWKDEYEARIIAQLKAIGASCDWKRWRFTLDEVCARAVRHTFFRLFQSGLIYRGKRLVNWDVQLQTAVADDEVYHDDVEGKLWHFRYPVEGSEEYLEIATTRPETMLGDTAVAVHPNDPRYQHLIGRSVRLPLMDRLIPIIADGLLVDMAFGTGVVKVTPAHDPNDYACGLRNHLERINVLTPSGRINAAGGKYEGLKREEARSAVVADMESLGLVAKVEPHRHAVGHSDRSKTAIEPYLSDQWFVRMADLAETAMRDVREGRVRIHPPRYRDTYLAWLGEKRDWCISRQLWWGHQIPIWSFSCDDEASLAAMLEAARQIAADRPDLAHVEVQRSDGSVATTNDGEPAATIHVCLLEDDAALVGQFESIGFTRDPDVLDTWFSSALWPHSTFGWPEITEELQYYYPTNLLSTAREIITLWVARMVLFSEFNLNQVPFTDVFIHPVIQDGNGMPMKKSLGNGVDPFDIIAKYGADAMRFTLVSMTTETQDVRLPVKKEKLGGREVNTSEKFEIGRNFGTKIYNAARFMLMNLEGHEAGAISPPALPLEDRWILSRLSATTAAATDALERFEFAGFGRLLYEFVWGELCDWYIEVAKPRLRSPEERRTAQRVSALVLDQTVRLLHPVMPFLTEEIWKALGEVAPKRGWPRPHEPAEAAAVAAWPSVVREWRDDDAERQMRMLQDLIRAVRNIRSQFGLSPRAELTCVLDADAESAALVEDNLPMVRLLASIGSLRAAAGAARPPKSAAHVLSWCKLYVPLADLIDVAAEIAKQEKKSVELAKRLEGVRKKLSDQSFVSRAPADVVAQQQALEADLSSQFDAIHAILADLRG